MIESCLKRNIVNKFLKKYKPKKWNSIIPSLLEIGILYLHNTYKILLYSEDDLSKIIEKLKFKNTTNQSIKAKFYNLEMIVNLIYLMASSEKEMLIAIIKKQKILMN
jgi:hypothetical protein